MGSPNEVREGRVVTFDGKWHFNLRLVLKGCPNLGPPLSHSLSMVQSDLKRFGICGYTIYYKHYYGNKLFE